MAGTFGKIAFSEDILDEMKFAVGLSLVEAYDVLILQATFISLTIVTNVIMMGTFLHALSLSATTIYVTATNTAANFLTTAFLGYTFFNEQLTTRWFVGISLILAGISILTKSKDDTEPETREKDQKEE